MNSEEIEVNDWYVCRSELFEYEFIGQASQKLVNACIVEITHCEQIDQAQSEEYLNRVVVSYRHMSN
ncbi:hypothetical protein I6N95_03775 [Vagococcus sp. BWB3-3]|uniref:Uncharacterized protein n=1 Tax=Vagococcus allomyrinae TaxID=2794353 RepID=A0A940STW5_9ENTE|nr:hypothetical protein [Vagococcus allomyrinae]MBP1040124.1 hypothetical protein [Vagococcus allomyrinae]